MTYYDLLKQYVSTGYPLTEYQFNKIKKDGQLLNSYFYSRNKELKYYEYHDYDDEYYEDYDLKYYESDFINKNPKYFSKFDSSNLKYFMIKSPDPDSTADNIIKLKGNTLDSDEMFYLVRYSKNKSKIIQSIINAKGSSLNSDDMHNLFILPENVNEIIRYIINAKGNNLLEEEIIILLYHSPYIKKTKNLLIQAGVDPSKIPNQ